LGNQIRLRRLRYCARSWLYWLVYRKDGLTIVQVVRAYSLVAARLYADIATPRLGGHFVEGHDLDETTAARVSKNTIATC